MAKRVNDELKKEYQKERRRLQQAVRRGEQEGLVYPEDILPPIPKYISRKHVEQLHEIKPKDLRKRAQPVFNATDEIERVQRITQPEVRTRKGRPIGEEYLKHPRTHSNMPKLSKEVRSQASKKAWQTRWGRMSEEEREAYRQRFKDRMREGRERKRKEREEQGQPYYPTKSPIQVVYRKIEELEARIPTLTRKEWAKFQITYRDHELLQLLIDMVDSYEQKDAIDEYEKYLVAHESQINELLDAIEYQSDAPDQSGTTKNFGELATLLKQGALTPHEAEQYSAMAERDASYEDWE